MLSNFLLSFRDTEMKTLYDKDNQRYHLRAVLLVTLLLLLACISLEIIYRLTDHESFSNMMIVEIVSWATLVILCFLNFTIRRAVWTQKLVCPLLTIYLFFLLIESDGTEKESVAVLWAKSSIGTAAIYYVLVMFNEAWVVNVAIFIPCIAISLYRTAMSIEIFEMDFHWLVLIGLFQLFTYTSIAYKTERLSKMSFLGRESSEKSFTRWLQIFDTFPEGMAIVKDDGNIMYSNKSLARLLEQDQQTNTSASNFSSVGVKTDVSLLSKKILEGVRIKKYEVASDFFEKPDSSDSSYSVWDFIAKNSNGATFQITTPPVTADNRLQRNENQEETKVALDNLTANQVVTDKQIITTKENTGQTDSIINAQAAKPPRYLSLDQVKVSLAGPRVDKIFIARDESYIVTLRELETTRRHMIEFTQNMMCLVDDFASVTSQNLRELVQTAANNPAQQELLNECLSEMRRARYSIRDFQYIHDVAENNFLEPVFRCVDIRSSLDELRKVCLNDSQKLMIEIKSEVSKNVPKLVAVEENLFIQVMINLLRMAMDTIVNKGYITMLTTNQTRNQVPNVVIDFQLSACKLDEKERHAINRLSNERDFKRILAAEVEPHFKIAKILCNQLGWRIEFDSNRDLRYQLCIPLLQEPSTEDQLILSNEDIEEIKEEDQEPRRTPGIQPERIIASQQSQRNKNKQYWEQSTQNTRQSRPLTVDDNVAKRNKYFEPVQEEPEGVEELEDNLRGAYITSPQTELETQSYREDTRTCTCATFLLMNSTQKELLEEVLSVKCHEVIIINEVVKKIQKSLQKTTRNCHCKNGYKYLIIDTQNMPQKLELRYLLEQIGPLYGQLRTVEDRENVYQPTIIVFWVENNRQNAPELLKAEVGDANIQFYQKPVNKDDVKTIFLDSQMAQGTSNTKTNATVLDTTEEAEHQY